MYPSNIFLHAIDFHMYDLCHVRNTTRVQHPQRSAASKKRGSSWCSQSRKALGAAASRLASHTFLHLPKLERLPVEVRDESVGILLASKRHVRESLALGGPIRFLAPLLTHGSELYHPRNVPKVPLEVSQNLQLLWQPRDEHLWPLQHLLWLRLYSGLGSFLCFCCFRRFRCGNVVLFPHERGLPSLWLQSLFLPFGPIFQSFLL
mmetsp:Transcript_35132/g.76780  ORF Transcript_35132/g.76780 Transcript_35132/m.76780 type:complete len:205 (+) Transcript_35132:1632-2246(+)